MGLDTSSWINAVRTSPACLVGFWVVIIVLSMAIRKYEDSLGTESFTGNYPINLNSKNTSVSEIKIKVSVFYRHNYGNQDLLNAMSSDIAKKISAHLVCPWIDECITGIIYSYPAEDNFKNPFLLQKNIKKVLKSKFQDKEFLRKNFSDEDDFCIEIIEQTQIKIDAVRLEIISVALSEQEFS